MTTSECGRLAKCEVVLHSPENCFLGSYLFKTRVFIIDDYIFPPNKFADEITNGPEEVLANLSMALLFEYIQFTMLQVPTIFWTIVATAFLDQLWNVYYLLTIYIQVYLMDRVLNLESDEADLLYPHNRPLTAFALACLYFLPNVILLAVGGLKRGVLDVNKPIRVHLQVSLFRQYLSYTEASKQLVQVQT